MFNYSYTRENGKFFVNEEKRKVVCVLENTADAFENFADQNFPIFISNLNIWEKVQMPDKFIGIATCSPDDEFDIEIGEKLAYSRAKDNFNKCFFNRAEKFFHLVDDCLERSVDIINTYGDKVRANTTHRHEVIADLIGDNY